MGNWTGIFYVYKSCVTAVFVVLFLDKFFMYNWLSGNWIDSFVGIFSCFVVYSFVYSLGILSTEFSTIVWGSFTNDVSTFDEFWWKLRIRGKTTWWKKIIFYRPIFCGISVNFWVFSGGKMVRNSYIKVLHKIAPEVWTKNYPLIFFATKWDPPAENLI